MRHDTTPTVQLDGEPHVATGSRGDLDADVVVVGAGLAGLTAAVTAARSGASVVLLDAGRPGGRARTTVVDPGVVFNAGPRALYRDGPAWRILGELGIDPTGGAPSAQAGHIVVDGHHELMPATPWRLLRTGALGLRSKVAVGRLLGGIGRLDAVALQGRTLGGWARSTLVRPDAVALVLAVTRLATYVDDPEHMDAAAAVAQLQLVLGNGVWYLDDGFGQLVEALRTRAEEAGVQLVDHASVRTVRPVCGESGAPLEGRPSLAGGWELDCGDVVRTARRVVLATGTPAAAAALSPVSIDTSGLSAPVEAACLELAVRGVPATPFLMGLDEPLYLSLHSPPAALAPDGVGVVHVMRYGVTSADADRRALWRHARAAGIDEGRVVAQRFLRRMVVSGGAPLACAGGLAGRPPVQVPGAPGLFLAGDWVGDEGLLSDAAVASGASAGRLAAGSGSAGARAGGGADVVRGAVDGVAAAAPTGAGTG